MSTFSKLSLLAQYDDMCRLVNKLISDSAEEEDAAISMLESLQKRWNNREAAHDSVKEELKVQINSLQKEIKKLNRQLAESRTALVREAEEKKTIARERKALLEQIKQVRLLVESKDSLGDSDAHRRRVIKCLDVERLSPIQSDDSDDCVSGLDYDRTEEDIVENERSRRSNAFEDALESLHNNEQPALLFRYLEKGNDNNGQKEEPRRSSRRSGGRSRATSYAHLNEATGATQTNSQNNKEKYADIGLTETDSNGMETDDNDIEYVRQQLQKYETEKKEKLASTNSTPNVRNQGKSATLSAKSTTNLMKTISNVSTPLGNAHKPHTFVNKKNFKPDLSCGPCSGKISFYGNVVKCENCGVISHPECKEKCPLPCVKITAPNTRSRQKKVLISDYVNSDAIPKVPALIVHCCNEIERSDNIITEGLYRVVASTKDIEELQQKILKSKSGMPNLSKVDVHLLTGVVKRFLQSLDESLITTTLWSHFAEAIRLDSAIEIQTHMSYYISFDLPSANRDTLAYLMQHLHSIAKCSDKNLMTAKSLAKTLAPTIIGNSCRNPPAATILEESKIQIRIMETLFDIEEDFWTKFVHKSESSTPVSSLGSRLLGTPSGSVTKTRTSSRLTGTLPTPKLKPLFS